MAVLVDTGILYALADADDAWHKRARDYVEGSTDLMVTTQSVLPEVTHLLHKRLGSGAERRFLDSLVAGEIAVEALVAADLKRCAALLERYPEIGFVDASVVAVAERLGVLAIATTDRRHFSRIRPRHGAALHLVP